MTKYQNQLTETFSALADPTRRAIVSRLCEGPASIGELSEPFKIALPTLLKHVQILEKSGLVSTQKTGRVRTCRIETGALKAGDDWLRQHLALWEDRLDRMEHHINTMKKEH
ncbi:ArsR/SmtB family transcription factor [Aquisalinus flavus]|uniref:Transcriptional regulator n=1 Tax=Aquisalinus flavus TaxID=1526572 RepID=A0A8J2V5E5_9PROT|nr:metalloregulator ArsR/SmtB family transcription factor [Aquisalinus flavus]MBD0427434.1 winged helix-turn-helix transcriptional regulator [Aquisalinus flavus]UNE47237.1 winged helix-turn-helix transcriptional regulator [Aquisalinus flavus]GGD00998.1 transcriptional regulator [Aquisalinus flavus]